ncbi:hypothetical protein ACFOGJ_19110 [Marinibaculum pumilum]|uniref:Uncharacterized protein n=1 Tax=Marinibaculum pumilum TaxID=1766165 RepID=A0ABV7L4T6_9PROT
MPKVPAIRRPVSAVPAIASVALAAFIAAPAAQAAELTSFSCSDERLARNVTTMPVTFQKSADSPVSKTFTAHLQGRKSRFSAPEAITATCELKPDLHYIVEGYDRATGRYLPVNGAYKMAIACKAVRADGTGYQGIERRLSIPAPAQGGPFDDPEARSRFDTAACQSATSAIRGSLSR